MTFFDKYKEGIVTILFALFIGGFIFICIAYAIDRDSSALSDVTISEFKENEKIEGKVIAHHKTGKTNHRSILQLDDGRYYVTSSFEFTGRTVQKLLKSQS